MVRQAIAQAAMGHLGLHIVLDSPEQIVLARVSFFSPKLWQLEDNFIYSEMANWPVCDAWERHLLLGSFVLGLICLLDFWKEKCTSRTRQGSTLDLRNLRLVSV